MRAQVRDLMEKHQDELKKVSEKYERELSEKEMMSSASVTSADSSVDPSVNQRLSELEGKYILLVARTRVIHTTREEERY